MATAFTLLHDQHWLLAEKMQNPSICSYLQGTPSGNNSGNQEIYRSRSLRDLCRLCLGLSSADIFRFSPVSPRLSGGVFRDIALPEPAP
mmetsp:Transcript_54485/g.90765  ORF Transcript_54485/g.90765 Transcript_54485/m.90765 type:complete len:89 (+) Transcript_54485:104-370(+)